MKVVIFALIVLVLAVGVELFTQDNPGYVAIGYGQWVVEATLTLAIVVFGLLLLGGYFVLRFISHLWQAPKRVGESRKRRRNTRASRMLIEGLIDLEEENWARAERALIKDIPHSHTPFLNYLSAARAAQNEGAYERRNQYLRLAREIAPASSFAVELVQVEWQLDSGQFDQALSTLHHLRALDPKHPKPLKLLKSFYLEQRDWVGLLDLLPELRKRRLVSKEEMQSLEVMACAEFLQEAARSEDDAYLIEEWKRVPNRLQSHPRVVAVYTYALLGRNEHDLAEQLLRDTVKRNWSDELVYLYGLAQSSDLVAQLTHAESWLSQRGDNPWLLLTLGRLAQYNGLWGKARQYLEACIKYAPRPEAYRELGKVLEEMGDSDAALECYSKGLSMTIGGALEEGGRFILPEAETRREASLPTPTTEPAPQLAGPG